MASHQDFVDYVAEQLREAGIIRSRKMFGEYGLYCDGIFFAVICDNQFFVKVYRPARLSSLVPSTKTVRWSVSPIASSLLTSW